jgi:hypothetical protein
VSTSVDLANRQRGPACLAGDALVSYLYDECTFEERQRIEGHLTSCGACAAEVEELGGTRVQLASWTPPDAALGFRISAATAPAVNASAARPHTPAPVVPLPWWRQPMPAWAQAVAATVLFGLGMAAGSRQLPITPSAAGAPAPVSASQLTNLESRLRREIAAMHAPDAVPAPVAAAARLSDADRDALLRQVREMVRESEDRQQQTFTIRAAQVARDAEIQRRVDVANLRQTFEQIQGSTSEVQRQQGEMLKYLVNVSQRR